MPVGNDSVLLREAPLGESRWLVSPLGRRSGSGTLSPPALALLPPAPREPVPDRWMTTMLFTDIVGSTDEAARHGDARWLALVNAHEVALRSEVRRFRGRVVSTTGDGFVAAFPSPTAAVVCATGIAAGTRALGLAVRAGIHAGECERRGRRVGGIVFHIGARVAALAASGEVLVSHTVKDLVTGSGLVFAPRGVRQLKGVPGRWALYAAAVRRRATSDAGG